jgi:hypothetical protein
LQWKLRAGNSIALMLMGAQFDPRVQVAVTIPAGTTPGVTDTLTLTATSRLASGVSTSAQATTVSSYEIYLPLILKSAG